RRWVAPGVGPVSVARDPARPPPRPEPARPAQPPGGRAARPAGLAQRPAGRAARPVRREPAGTGGPGYGPPTCDLVPDIPEPGRSWCAPRAVSDGAPRWSPVR